MYNNLICNNQFFVVFLIYFKIIHKQTVRSHYNLLFHLTSSSLIPHLNKTPLASSYRSAEALHLLILLSQCAQISNLVLHFFIRVSTNLHTFSGTPIHAYRFRVRVLSLSFDSSLYIRYNTGAHVVNSTYYKYRILSIHDG